MSGPSRRALLGAWAAGSLAAPLASRGLRPRRGAARTGSVLPGSVLMVGSENALPGMAAQLERLATGASPLDVVIDVVKRVEADPSDSSVGLGGLPNEDGVVSLDAACMDGATHNAGAVAAIENILHPSEVARLVMERTDHCLIVGRGAYEFARAHGHAHVELLTEEARRRWMRWKETMSTRDDRLPPAVEPSDEKHGSLPSRFDRHGTVHCSALSSEGEVACTTTTSGLAWKIPGRVGDSPLVGAGLYCDGEVGSAGSTGRGEAVILAGGSLLAVELMRQGLHPKDAGLAVLGRIASQVQRQAKWQPELLREDGRPAFGLKFYLLDLGGRWAGVSMHAGRSFAVADPEEGARLEPLTPLFE